MPRTVAKNYPNAYLIGMAWQLAAVLMLVSMAVVIKISAKQMSVAEIIYYRATFGFFIISLVAIGFILGGQRRLQTMRPRQPWMIALRTAFNLVAMATGFYAVAHLHLGTAAVLSSTKVFFLIPLSALFLGEKSRPITWFYNFIAFGGAMLILLPSDPPATPPINLLAGGAAVVHALFVAAGIVTLRALGRQREHPVVVVFWVATATALAVQPFAPAESPLFNPHSLILLLTLTVLGLGGQFCNVLSYRYVEAPSVAVFSFLRLALALLYGYVFFSESPNMWAILGMVLIIITSTAAGRHGLHRMPIKRGLQVELRDAT